MTSVKSEMTRKVTFAVETDDLRQVHMGMRALGVRHVPVTRKGVVIGMISERDVLLHGRVDKDGKMSVPAIPVGEVMRVPVVTCRQGDSIGSCVDALLKHRISSLPVVDASGKLLGILTTTDLLRLLREKDWTPEKRIPFQWESIPLLSQWRKLQPAV